MDSAYVSRWFSGFRVLVMGVFLLDTAWVLSVFSETQSFSQVAAYMFGVFVALPLSALVVYGLFVSGMLGRLMQAVYVVLLYLLASAWLMPDYVLGHLLYYGILFGFVNVAIYFGDTLVSATQLTLEDGLYYGSRKQVLYGVLGIFVPILVYLVQTLFEGLSVLYGLMLLAIVMGVSFVVKMPSSNDKKAWGLRVFSHKANGYAERKTLVLLGFVMGVRSGIFWAFFSVMILSVVGSVGWWAVVTIGLKILSMWVSRYLSSHWNRSLVDEELTVLGIFYMGIALVMVVNMHIWSFLLFALADAVYNVFLSMHWGYAQQQSMKMSSQVYAGHGLLLMANMSVYIGRLIVLVVLGVIFVGGADEGNLQLSSLVFLLVGVLPLLVYRILHRSHLFSLREGEYWQC